MGTKDCDLPFPVDRMVDPIAHTVVADVDKSSFKKRIERAATLNERLRLARELHDGVLQSLTGAALQLEAMSRVADGDPNAVRTRLSEIRDLLVEEQVELRKWMQNVGHPTTTSKASFAELANCLEPLCRRTTRWGPRVQRIGPSCGTIERTLGDHVYRLVEEGLSNVTRHARAQAVRVEIEILPQHVRIVIEDDGCGFKFRGRYDLATLNVMRQGPASLKERIASLEGTLVLTSTLSGSRLEIGLPVRAQPLWHTTSSARRA
jgi:signal transduction histidine kinase